MFVSIHLKMMKKIFDLERETKRIIKDRMRSEGGEKGEREM